MRKATIIIIAAIYVASIVIVGVFGLRALNFEQTIFIKDIVMPTTINGQPVTTADGKSYSVELTYRDGLEALIDIDKEPRDAQGDIDISITLEIPYGDKGDTVAELKQSTNETVLKFFQAGLVILRFEAADGSKVTKELIILVLDQN